MPKYTYGVYVILLDKKVLDLPRFTSRSPEYDPDLDCYYVGMSAKSPEERFRQHKNHWKSNYFVREFGIRLVPELYENIPRYPTRDEAKEKEEELAIGLRELGHAAYWNGDDVSMEELMTDTKEATLAKMDGAAKDAEERLKFLLESMNPEQRNGAHQMIIWFKENYLAAGYKRLGRILKDLP